MPTPLPLALIRNRRSLVSVRNLSDLLIVCLFPPAPCGHNTFLASDGEPVSTPRLLQLLSEEQGRRALLFPFPVDLLDAAARLPAIGSTLRRLTESLEIDITETTRVLGWEPAKMTSILVSDQT